MKEEEGGVMLDFVDVDDGLIVKGASFDCIVSGKIDFVRMIGCSK